MPTNPARRPGQGRALSVNDLEKTLEEFRRRRMQRQRDGGKSHAPTASPAQTAKRVVDQPLESIADEQNREKNERQRQNDALDIKFDAPAKWDNDTGNLQTSRSMREGMAKFSQDTLNRPPKTPAQTQRSMIPSGGISPKTMLRNPDNIKAAIVLSEILGPPRALKSYSDISNQQI